MNSRPTYLEAPNAAMLFSPSPCHSSHIDPYFLLRTLFSKHRKQYKKSVLLDEEHFENTPRPPLTFHSPALTETSRCNVSSLLYQHLATGEAIPRMINVDGM